MEFLYLLEKIRVPRLNELMLAVTELGGEMPFLIIALVVFWCVDKRRGYYHNKNKVDQGSFGGAGCSCSLLPNVCRCSYAGRCAGSGSYGRGIFNVAAPCHI